MKWFHRFLNVTKQGTSLLYDSDSFYPTFWEDLRKAKREVIIESPFITVSRMEAFYPAFQTLLERGVKIHVVTRDPSDIDDEYFQDQAVNEIMRCVEMGVNVVLLKGKHHRKIAILDRQILWEGSLNILSQSRSLEVMSRTEDKGQAKEMLRFLKLCL